MVGRMNKVELLAPVGNFEALLAVINAGADAVYLSGKSFGARAYADNFNDDELISAIELAHLFGVKIYLTVNTLLKEREKKALIDFLTPLASAGLDAVIVQDLGVIMLISEHFPNLAIHASTQMSLVSFGAVNCLKNFHVTRIVPARECSLVELREIKKQTGIEIESFIHGAMCYCYSGQCLFSSFLGGRSGNRGRCAQPCRLAYQYANPHEEKYSYGKDNLHDEDYPLSMKDMCTIKILPKLIESGIDSFKIEGRMKKSVYAAGVTSIYRKYIDMYYETGKCEVSSDDMNVLKKLYIRTGVSEGYYEKHNGRDMITLSSPAYSGSDDRLIEYITEKYIDSKPFLYIDGIVRMYKGEPICISLSYGDKSVDVTGDICEEAKKMPISGDKLYTQIDKTKDSYFRFKDLKVLTDEESFLPIGAINELRRNALSELFKVIVYGS